jgi:hypothetical protein
VTGDAPDCGGTGSARTSAAGSGEGETSVVMGAVEEVGAERDVEAVGEVGERSFFANAFFSLARLFWNHTFTREVGEASGTIVFSAVKKTTEDGERVPVPPWETS